MNDSFGSRATLRAGGREFRIARLDALEKRGLRRLAPALLPAHPAREPAAPRGRPRRHRGRHRGARRLGPQGERRRARSPSCPARVLLQDFTGVPAVVDLAAMRDAMKPLGGDPKRINPLAAGRSGHRPLGAGRRVRHRRRLRASTPSSSSSATASATRSCAGARRRSTTSASCRRTPASSTRSTSNTWRAWSSTTTATATARLPRHPGRHRLAHHHDQRPGRARLGRRRHRGRGGDARPAASPC